MKYITPTIIRLDETLGLNGKYLQVFARSNHYFVFSCIERVQHPSMLEEFLRELNLNFVPVDLSSNAGYSVMGPPKIGNNYELVGAGHVIVPNENVFSLRERSQAYGIGLNREHLDIVKAKNPNITFISS